jgi:hypothetical protein
MKMISALAILFLAFQVATKHVIWDEQLSADRLAKRVDNFNEWYKKLNPSAKVSAKLKDDQIVLISDENLKVK